MDYYVRLCKTLNDRGKLLPASTIYNKSILDDYINKSPETDWYGSVFLYPKDALEHFKNNNNSIAGYNGKAYSNKLIFDFDSKQSVEKAREDAIEVLNILSEKLDIDAADYSNIFFSGSKGFHVEFNIKTPIERDQAVKICTSLCENLNTFDESIYKITQPYRLPNTKHNKSGLFKIEIEPDELLEWDIEQIKEKAKSKNGNPFISSRYEDNEKLKKLIKEKKPSSKPKKTFKRSAVVAEEDESGVRGLNDIDFSKCPNNVPRCIFALQRGIMIPGIGERNALFFRLARYYQAQGYSKDNTHNILKSIARQNKELYPEAEEFNKNEIWNTIIKSVFDGTGSWKVIPGSVGTSKENELLIKYCSIVDKYTNKKCCYHNKETTSQDVVKIDDIFANFKKYAKDIDKNAIYTGLSFIDQNMKLAIGTTTLLVGSAGVGKTTMMLNILENANAADQHAMFFSMDMHQTLVYQKIAQKITKYTSDDIYKFFKTGDTQKIMEIKDKVNEKFDKTFFDFSPSLTIDEIKSKIYETEQRNNVDIKLVMIDYAGRLKSEYKDTHHNANHNALASTAAAAETNSAWIILSQISRQSGDCNTPLKTKRVAKESGAWEESCNNMITMWRPFYQHEIEEDDTIKIFLAKNRLGPEITGLLHWDTQTGTIRDYTEDEILAYKASERDKKEFGAKKPRRFK